MPPRRQEQESTDRRCRKDEARTGPVCPVGKPDAVLVIGLFRKLPPHPSRACGTPSPPRGRGLWSHNFHARKRALGLAAPSPDGGPPLAGKPYAVLVIGLCGGLTESLPEGRIVAFTECLSTRRGTVPHVIPDSHLSAQDPSPGSLHSSPSPPEGARAVI